MRHLVMTRPQCLLYSAAMVLDLDIEDITDLLGHDGMEKVNDQPEPHCYKGVHMQEIQTVAYRIGRLFAPVELVPVADYVVDQVPLFRITNMDYSERFVWMTKGRKGILVGLSPRGNEHAVAFQDGSIFDPCGKKYGLGSFRTREAWILC